MRRLLQYLLCDLLGHPGFVRQTYRVPPDAPYALWRTFWTEPVCARCRRHA